jgi:hypothetical protein
VTSRVLCPRRYYLLKAQAARLADPIGHTMVNTWWGKQEGEPGAALPGDFPSREALAAAHYTTVEDLTGAGTQELVVEARLTTKQADAVIAALAAL